MGANTCPPFTITPDMQGLSALAVKPCIHRVALAGQILMSKSGRCIQSTNLDLMHSLAQFKATGGKIARQSDVMGDDGVGAADLAGSLRTQVNQHMYLIHVSDSDVN
jgi:hypothetical protein